ncbi:uncharacterized protein RAG0_17447 [Rhynchosporium agropyri]|uniref:Uncharacterized protein n=1 Tax=Rhynchosporium agropyri TaxID=914238 RepID=A0A1E1LTX5_9HELO|nr:uncharacterized protein RAG0_17447 [Rhynchosporium agropyri]
MVTILLKRTLLLAVYQLSATSNSTTKKYTNYIKKCKSYKNISISFLLLKLVINSNTKLITTLRLLRLLPYLYSTTSTISAIYFCTLKVEYFRES